VLNAVTPVQSLANYDERDIPMAEHEHGTMNTEANEKTFDGFVSFVSRSVMVIIGILVFMAIFAR
jgi:hypothetical protein